MIITQLPITAGNKAKLVIRRGYIGTRYGICRSLCQFIELNSHRYDN